MAHRILLLAVFLGFFGSSSSGYSDEGIIATCDLLSFRAPGEKGGAKLVPGKLGQAIEFTFEDDARGVFFTSNIRGAPEWDEAAGLSFWVKGDGSQSFGGLEFIYDEDYALRYDYMFPISSRDWTKITVAWSDLLPVLPRPNSKPLDPHGENKPSKLSALWVGKWWYWGEYPACSFAIDEIRLERKIEQAPQRIPPAGDPLARVKQKLKARQEITIVTMGDSLTDFRHWANRKNSWPTLLRDRLRERFHSEVKVVNPAIGGTQLQQNLVLLPRWLALTPEPDLVCVCFGGNDWEAGMRGEMFREASIRAVDRLRAATHGTADILLLTTVPSVLQWETRAELARACREAARERNAGLVDLEQAFWIAGGADRERLFVDDRVHLSAQGHQLIADQLLAALSRDD